MDRIPPLTIDFTSESSQKHRKRHCTRYYLWDLYFFLQGLHIYIIMII